MAASASGAAGMFPIPNSVSVSRSSIPLDTPLMSPQLVNLWRQRFNHNFTRDMPNRLKIFIGREEEGIELFRTMEARKLMPSHTAKRLCEIINNKFKSPTPEKTLPNLDELLMTIIKNPSCLKELDTKVFDERLEELGTEIKGIDEETEKLRNKLEKHGKRKREITGECERLKKVKTVQHEIADYLLRIVDVSNE